MKRLLLLPLACSILVLTSCQSFSNDKTAQTSTEAELSPYPYQGEVTLKLMPIDWTFLAADVPVLISELEESDFSALYVDADKSVRVVSASDIQISYDAGVTWTELNTGEVSAGKFSEWLWQNDPIPGYSMENLQERLNQGAEVRHVVFDNNQEIYFVVDEYGVQIELVQPEKMESVLMDGVRLMFTSTSTNFSFSNDIISIFGDILENIGVTEKSEAVLEWDGVIEHLGENGASFYGFLQQDLI